MRSKRVVLIAAVALIAAGSVFGVALWAARSDSRPFDDDVAMTELAPVEDWTLPKGAKFVSANKGEQGTIVLVLDYNGQKVGVAAPRLTPQDDIQATMAFQMGTLQRRDVSAGDLVAATPWIPVRVRQDWRDSSVMIGEGYANRSARAIVTLKRDQRLGVHIWNARDSGHQLVLGAVENEAELRVFLEFIEAFRVPEFNDEADLKAKWEAFVERVGGK